jgi:hypothetical protein
MKIDIKECKMRFEEKTCSPYQQKKKEKNDMITKIRSPAFEKDALDDFGSITNKEPLHQVRCNGSIS